MQVLESAGIAGPGSTYFVAWGRPCTFPFLRMRAGVKDCLVNDLWRCVGRWSTVRLSGEDEVVQAGDAEHGVVDAVAFQAAVAEDLPALHPGEGVLDAGSDFAVGGVVFLLPGGQFGLAAFAAVRYDQAGAPIAAVGDHRGLADGRLGSGQVPRLAVVAVAGQRRPTATISWLSASMTTWWLVE